MRASTAVMLAVLAVTLVAGLGISTLGSGCLDEGPCTGYQFVRYRQINFWLWDKCYPIPWKCVTLAHPEYDDCRQTCRWKYYEDEYNPNDSCWDLILDVTVCYR